MAAQRGALKKTLTAATSTAVGGVLKLQNPEGVELFITRLVLDIPTKSTGVAALDAGIDDDGAQSSDIQIDGLAVGTAPGVFDNIEDGGTNGKATVKWPVGHYLVITASATTAGMVGSAYIEWFRGGA